MRYKYLTSDYQSQTLDSAYQFSSDWDESEGNGIARDAAEDYHSNHDGWESIWPIKITVYKMDGSLIGKYSVDREAVPQFYAYEIKGD
jgi:hypothetical protein